MQRLSRLWPRRDPSRRYVRQHPCRWRAVDGNLVSAPTWPAHPEWLAKFLAVMGAKIEL